MSELEEAIAELFDAYSVQGANSSAIQTVFRLARLGAAVEAMPRLSTLVHCSGYTNPEWKLFDDSEDSSMNIIASGQTVWDCFATAGNTSATTGDTTGGAQ